MEAEKIKNILEALQSESQNTVQVMKHVKDISKYQFHAVEKVNALSTNLNHMVQQFKIN